MPPKDPYIKVRVLDDMGEGILLSDKTANLARHSMHFLKRTDAEQYIARVDFNTFNLLNLELSSCMVFRTPNFSFLVSTSIGQQGLMEELTG